MPIYEYRCDACGHELEAIRKFSDAPLTTCPACGKETLIKKVSAAGFQLKGSGWYQTDFRGGSKPPATAVPKSDSAAADTKSGGDSKAADTSSTGKSETPATSSSDSKASPAGGSTPATP